MNVVTMILRGRLAVTSDSSARIRIVLGGAELDLQGEPAFIEKYDETIQALLAKLKSFTPERSEINATRGVVAKVVSVAPAGVAGAAPGLDDPEDFGEVLHRVPRSATGVDKALVAAWFVSRLRDGKPFETKDVSTLLVENGVRLPNPSQAMTNNANRKLIFKSGGGYRVSREGIEFVERLLSETE
jgi:hypothetical protein